ISTDKVLGDFTAKAREIGVNTALGEHKIEIFQNTDLIVLSPGVPHTIVPVQRARERGIPVWGEIELAFRFIQDPILAVSGTNGKSTTTALLGEMLSSSGFRVFVGGNIGNPLIDYADRKEKADLLVVEVSSFQLDTIESFRPKIGVLLNIEKDHMDRYPDFNAYAESKARMFENRQAGDIAVLNGADPKVRLIGEKLNLTKLFFNHRFQNEKGATLNGKHLSINLSENLQPVIDFSGIKLIGRHNMENASAACLAACAAGGTVEGIQTALNTFKGLRHRLQLVATVNDVTYINDSKATNVNSVVRALEIFDKPVILILGGRGKEDDFYALKGPVHDRVKMLIVMGETAGRLKSIFERSTPTVEVYTMKEAVRFARQEAVQGDVVLLSPACSSFDMFSDFTERGDLFCREVQQLR
ncbi:MAG: UDP-N-acetylmuramoyl-L-alanine--D-glutamate ligase, partial [Nitrospinales bacterium]